MLGGALGVVVAQRLKDRVPPVRLLLGSMVLLGVGTLIGGVLLSVAGFAVMLFLGFFSFFLGKISADTITQQAMPDDFRGRAFALFDIAYNLGYIVPALILYLVWEENSDSQHAGDPAHLGCHLPGPDILDRGDGPGGSATSSPRRTTWSSPAPVAVTEITETATVQPAAPAPPSTPAE